jgi:hypothetical protein
LFDVVEVGAHAAHRAGQLDGAEAREELLPEHARLEPRELRAQAEVLAPAKGEVRVRIARMSKPGDRNNNSDSPVCRERTL